MPARLERIARRAVSKNREARYVNAAELMKELQDAREEIGTSRRRRFPKRRLIFVAALLAGIACAVPAAHYIRTAIPGPSGRQAVPASDAIHSLAVLPFANDGAAAASDYLVDGITDTLIDDLSQIQQLKVASHDAVARYEGAAGDVRAAARALGVRAVLTGRVAQKGQNIAVTLDLAFGISRDGGGASRITPARPLRFSFGGLELIAGPQLRLSATTTVPARLQPGTSSNCQTNEPSPTSGPLASPRPDTISFPSPMTRAIVLFTATAIASAQPYVTAIRPADTPQEIALDRGSTALWQSLKKLHTRASLIMVTAHPDDEDGGMLTYESRGRGTRVALLTLNRGEGGANVMSPDYFDALGLVRTMELLQAGRYYGVEQYWTRVIDYGFSKTKAESIARWTHDRVLADVVRVVRIVRPLVVTSVFVGGPSDGHGNHQTAGAMAQEVFRAAADPTLFPRADPGRPAPLDPAEGLRARPRRVSAARTPSAQCRSPAGRLRPGARRLVRANRPRGPRLSEDPERRPFPPARPASSPVRTIDMDPSIPAGEKEAAFFDGIDVDLMGIASLADGGDTAFLRAGLARHQRGRRGCHRKILGPPSRGAPHPRSPPV